MKRADYLVLALRTEKKLPSSFARLKHAALGLITETGEAATEIKRFAIYGKSLDEVVDTVGGKEITRRMHIGEELGDAAWYLAIADDVCVTGVFTRSWDTLGLADAPPLDELIIGLAESVGGFCYAAGENDVEHAGGQLLSIAQVLHLLAQNLGLDIDVLLAENIAKLRKRFPDAYSDEAAEARADKDGRDARSS